MLATMSKGDRLVLVNEAVKVIGSHGRRFFYSKIYDRYALMEIDARGRLWWIDEYTDQRIYTHYNGRWCQFSNGGTLHGLVIHFKNFVQTGEPMPRVFGPWPQWYCDGDLWGYGDDMQKVRDGLAAIGLPLAPPKGAGPLTNGGKHVSADD